MAYAALLSLKQAMDLLQSISESKNLVSHSETPFRFKLKSFLKQFKSIPSSKIADPACERRVKDSVQTLEDLIDSHLLKLSDQSSEECSSSSYIDEDDDVITFSLLFSQQLQKVIEELTSFVKTLKTTVDQQQIQQKRYCFSSSSSSSDYDDTGKQRRDLVGLDDQIKTLKNLISHFTLRFLVASVVGMTGIGKTTLVKQVCSDPSIIEEFEIRLFVHMGPRYNQLEDIFMVVLNQLGVPCDKVHENNDYVKQLSEALSAKRYLIVLDDVWIGVHIWRKLDYYGFPDARNGSRVIIISQIQSFARSVTTHNVPLLKDDESWKLLHQTAFSTSEEKCSRELEKIGKKIARNCDGLPAAIIQVGENLRGKSFQEWKTLSENEDPLVIRRDDHTPLSKALFFSYMMLPQFLRACFLYLGVFPKKYGISRSKLIKLWVSEGFLDPYARISPLEETAGEYLDQLICRNVVLRETQASIDIATTKKCRLHFTFRSLCVSEAKSEKFFHILKKYTDCEPENIKSHKRLCVHNNVVLAFPQVHEWMESVPNARSLLCFGPKQKYPIVLPMCFRLLKILDALAIRLYEFPNQILALFHLRYLAITCDGELPNSISRLSNLEVFIVCQHHNIKLLNNGPVYLPVDIWNMHNLKQLYCMGFDLPPPTPNDSNLVLENLFTLSGVSVHSCTMEVLSRIPNLMRVAVHIESAHDSIETFNFFSHFASLYKKFDSFKCTVVNPNFRPQVVPSIPNFPLNITKICLSGCGLPWKHMELIGTLPTLRVLKLRWYAFCGPEWKTSDVQFPWLDYLLLEDLDIEHWESDGKQFPRLDHVIFRHCYKLKNIPDQLKSAARVEVEDCNQLFANKMRNWLSLYGTEAKIRSSSIDI
ncbi:hypothetical protein ABFS83_01G098000 [Erythranthe nasuta]